MGYELGKDWRIHVGDGAIPTEAFVVMGGEGSFEFTRASQEIDLSTKDDGEYALGDFGTQKITIAVSGKLKLPDASIQRIFTVSKSTSKRTKMKIRKGTTDKFLGEVAIGNFSMSAPTEGAVTYSFTATASAVPTVDDIAA